MYLLRRCLGSLDSHIKIIESAARNTIAIGRISVEEIECNFGIRMQTLTAPGHTAIISTHRSHNRSPGVHLGGICGSWDQSTRRLVGRGRFGAFKTVLDRIGTVILCADVCFITYETIKQVKFMVGKATRAGTVRHRPQRIVVP
jgi:hypothetical protein